MSTDASMSAQTRAFGIAVAAHDGQLDKTGRPYVEHPLRVRDRVQGESARTVALLHDVVEDSAWTLADLEVEGFAPHVVTAVDALTKRPGESLEDSMARVVGDDLARAVKCADLADNASLERLAALGILDRRRLEEKYARSAELLGTDLDAIRGSPARAALSREPAEQVLDADAAVARVLGPRQATRRPDESAWVVVGEVRDRGWAWVFASNVASWARDPRSGMVGHGLAVVAKDGSLVADTGSAPGQPARVDALEERWLWMRLARRLGDPDPLAV
jgi:hypothetical protein